MTVERFRDLGDLQVMVDGRAPSLGGRIPATILAVLLINLNRRVGPETLMDAIWGEDVSARATLTTHVWRLRNVLEPDRTRGGAASVLVNDGGGYRLVAAFDTVDSFRFEQVVTETAQLLRTGQPARALLRADEGIDLWRGRPFDLVADQAWAAPAVAKLVEQNNDLHRHRIDALLALGRSGPALASLQLRLGEHPLDETLWARRMLAEYRSGRADAALDSYQQIRRLLDDELGISPGAELQNLQRGILRQDPRLSSPPARSLADVSAREVHLPAGGGRLIGRTSDLAALSGMVRGAQLTTVVGAAGCGKTTLAVAVARSLLDEFVDGVWFIDLSAVAEPEHVVATTAAGLRAPVPPTGSDLDAVRAVTRRRRMLLVIDNAEHLLDATADLISILLADSTELSVLVTSREPLLMSEERLYQLAPLALPPPGSSDPVVRSGAAPRPVLSPAAELFVERMPRPTNHEEPDVAELRLVEEICAAVDGLPLAIELAAARHRAFSLAEIAAQVRSDASTLQAIGRGGSEHHRTVRSAIDRSYRLLSEDEQLLHRHLALVPGGATVSAAAALTGRSVSAVEGLLASLVHRSLVTPQEAARVGGATRFRQLATVRGHAEHQLTVDERQAAQSRLDAYVAEVLTSRGRRGRPEEADWMELLDDNLDALRASFRRHLIERPSPVGVDLFSRVGIYWYFRGRMVEARGWINRAGVVMDSLEPLPRALIEMGVGSGHCWRSRGDLARAPFRAALARTDDAASDRSIRWGEQLAIAAYGVFAANEALLGKELAERLQRVAAATGDRDLAALADGALVLVGAMNDDPRRVLATADAVQGRIDAVDNVLAHWFVADGATAAAVAAGDPTAGRRWSDRAAEACRRLRIGEGSVLYEQRANVFALAGDHRAAVELYAAAQVHQRRNGLIDWNFPATAGLFRRTRDRLGSAQFQQRWEQGQSMTLARALAVGV